MDAVWKTIIWRQFGAAIDMLDNAVRACPDELWRARLWNTGTSQPESAEFWYVAYHTLFWLDLQLSESAEGFAPLPPFTLDELDPRGLLPERVYTKEELLGYLEYGRDKCRRRIAGLTDELAPQHARPDWHEMSVAELLLYNLRHVQEHASQLNMLLGQHIDSAPGWVGRTKSQLGEG